MKRLLFALSVLFLVQNSSFAINWVQVITPLNRVAYVDSDSITEYKNYYFYNIKFQNPNQSHYTILTMQSSKSSPLSARLKAYSEGEYTSLNGDYANILNNMKSNLETVTYESVANTCYKKVKEIKAAESAKSVILLEDSPLEE